MIDVQIQTDVNKLSAALRAYSKYSGKTMEETIAKQGGKFAVILYMALKKLMPVKGSIRTEALARLKRGGGLKIRESIRRKFTGGTLSGVSALIPNKRKSRKPQLNLQARMVKREIGTRESGRGFLARSSFFPKVLTSDVATFSRFGPALSKAGVSFNADRSHVLFTWDRTTKLGAHSLEGMVKPKAQFAVHQALVTTTADIMVYVNRKMREAGRVVFHA